MIKSEKYRVSGMSCSACSAFVERAVGSLDGVLSVSVSLLTDSMTVRYDTETASLDSIISAVKSGGYDAHVMTAGEGVSDGDARAAAERGRMTRRLIWSAALTLIVMYLSMGVMWGAPIPDFIGYYASSAIQLALTLAVAVINRNYFRGGVSSVLQGAPTMDALVSLGCGASFIYSIYLMIIKSPHLYFESAAMILTLVTTGKLLEARTRRHTSDAIRALAALAPKSATVETAAEDGGVTVKSVGVNDIRVGDIIILREGETVPADGEIISGSVSCDESAVTGESVPIEKMPGDTVILPSVVVSGYARMRVHGTGADTTLSGIIALVEDAAASKAPVSRLADRVAAVFVPVVTAIAVLTAAIWLLLGGGLSMAVTCAVSVLVISCPCALGLATPAAITAACGAGARCGILIRSGAALEAAYKIKRAAFDKTGTLTTGIMEVSGIYPVYGSADALLSDAAAAEAMSSHPAAAAIVRGADKNSIPREDAKDYESVAGGGIRARVGGHKIELGNPGFMRECGVDTDGFAISGDYNRADTAIYVARDGVAAGIITVADRVRDDSADAVRLLKQMKIEPYMITGDTESTALAVAGAVSIPAGNCVSGVRPAGKTEALKKISDGSYGGEGEALTTAMIGDGINDAPVLAAADVGIAVAFGAGNNGTASTAASAAASAADIILLGSSPLSVVTALRLSAAAMRIIKQNLFWALCYNCVCIPVAAGALYPALHLTLNPMIASAAMGLSSLFVIGNALRLRKFK